MKYLVTIIVFVIAFSGVAQRERQNVPIYVPGTAYKNTGWFISPGITYMLPEDRREFRTSYMQVGDQLDTLYSGDISRAGKIGAYLEAGRHHFISGRFLLDHIDYGVHFKMLRGRESFSGIVNGAGAFVPVQSDSKFSESFVGGFFNASNILQITDRFWIQNSIGANVDYRLITRRVAGTPYGAEWLFPSTLLGQAHYKIGFGWKPEAGIYIMPFIETPILNIYPWDDGKSTLKYFTGRDRPFIITLRIQWLSKADARSCDPRPGAPNLEKSGKHENNDLWGPEDRKMKRKRKK